MLSFNLHKTFRNKGRIVSVTASGDLPLGKTSAIYGKSGVGKSTILRMIAGLETPDEGFIRLDQEVWFDAEKRINRTIAQRQPGFVFQEFNLFPNMTVERNLTYASNGPVSVEIKKLMDVVGLSSLMSNYPHELSGGEKQRVSIVRALCQHPKLLLLDEPFSALDDEVIGDLIREIKLIQQELGTTVVMISHRKDVIFEMADHVVHVKPNQMKNSDITIQGKPSDVLEKRF